MKVNLINFHVLMWDQYLTTNRYIGRHTVFTKTTNNGLRMWTLFIAEIREEV
jgi:hypothetical protein